MPTEIHHIGSATLEAGEAHYWEYWFGDFQESGVCYASVFPEEGQFCDLRVTEQGLRSQVRHVGGVWQPGGRSWLYTAIVRNASDSATAYHLRVARLLP